MPAGDLMKTKEWCDEEWLVPSQVTQVAGGTGEFVEQLVLERAITEGEVIVSVKKSPDTMLSAPDYNSVQVGESEHMNFGHKAIKMNHSNCPNTRIEISATCANIVSIKPIEAGVPLSFDYNTTEWEMSEPFTDWETGQNVQGFRHASAEEQRRLLTGFAAPHIKALAERHGFADTSML